MKKFTIQPGNEIRGMMIRLYPDKETEERLTILESDSKRVWNWLVKQTEEVIGARVAYAIRNNLVPPKPLSPIYDGLEPEVAKATAQQYRQQIREWHNLVYQATNKLPECAYRSFKELLHHFGFKYDYQLLKCVDGWYHENDTDIRVIEGGAHFYQALTKNYYSKGTNQRRKKFRRAHDSMPLQVRSGECFELGDFGHRRGNPFYNCQITFNGLKIKGRLPGKTVEGRVLEGVSITRKADSWWASIKQEVPIRIPPPAIPGSVIGIDMGLDDFVAMSEVRVVQHPEEKTFEKMGDVAQGRERPIYYTNPRGKEYANIIAEKQSQKKPVGRLHLSAHRHMRHLIYNDVIKPLSNIEIIKVEKLNSKIGQMGSSKVSVMRTTIKLLQERYGERVREVPPHYTSQDCSQCGHRSEESWSYERGRTGQCPSCGYIEHRDINAARNVAAKSLIPLNV